MKLSHAFAVTTAIVAIASPATARRTAIDTNPPITYSGYCDYNGDECVPAAGQTQKQMGFSVNFNPSDQAGATSSFIVYGNGLLSFGDKPNNYQNSTTPYYQNLLSGFGGQTISGGLFNTTTTDVTGDSVFLTTPLVVTNTENELKVLLDYCFGGRCYDESYIDITALTDPEDNDLNNLNGHLHVRIPFMPYSFDANPLTNSLGSTGAYINGVFQGYGSFTREDYYTYGFYNGAFAFDIPADIGPALIPTGAVPEPASWAMMIGGVGVAGGAMRQKRRVNVSKVAYA